MAEQAEQERDALAAGLRALAWLNEHADQVHMGLDGTPRCLPCSRFTAALLRGDRAEDARGLRCQPAQDAQEQTDVAFRIARDLA
ncbi:hypothetical protein ACFFX1_55535 [Dactylosporangium sucinum]|uniref:Uncharacterized protein n=1 Tax=Dactylosporangium sucinum TaxID=1424081 RepID=A0A917U3J1_9ACTN|nr:hypothetical protein [Dactylosporangium sucinum]GGM52547.1 hypothetical protein GCM10007977_062570 [Dactylosporangium sucinum]